MLPSIARAHQPPKRTCRGATIVGLFFALWASFACDAQPAAGAFRLGYVTPAAQAVREQVFRQELQRLGYVEGRNMVIEYRSADGDFERLPALVAELVALKVDVIAVRATQAALAAKKGAGTIPIVMVGVDDPVSLGLVASLGRPGGNVTGTATNAVDVVGKQFELLREMLPALSRVAALWNPANSVFQKRQVAEAKSVAAKLRMELQLVEARTAQDLDPAFTAMATQRPHAVVVLGDPLFAAHMTRIAHLALAPPAGGLRREGVCRGGRPRRLRSELFGSPSACGELCRPHPQGRQAGRPSSGANQQVRSRHQCEDREGAWYPDCAIAHPARHRGRRMIAR